MKLFPKQTTAVENAIAEARKAISIADQAESRCSAAEADQAAKRADFEMKVFESVASGAELPMANDLTHPSEVSRALSAAHRKFCARALESIQGVYRAGASAARAEAAQQRRQADEIRTSCRVLLEKLGRAEEVAYDYSILVSQRQGVWYQRFSGLKPASEFEAPGNCGPDPNSSAPYASPLSSRLLNQAATLDGRADDLEARANRLADGDLAELLAEAIGCVTPATEKAELAA